MKRRTGVWISTAALIFCIAGGLTADQPEMAIRVRHRDGQALAGVWIGTVEGSMDRSDGDGKAWSLVPPEKNPGDRITIQVRPAQDDPWQIISPEGGRTFVPSQRDFVEVILIRQSERSTENDGTRKPAPSNRPFDTSEFKRGGIIQHLSQGSFDELYYDREGALFYLIGLNTFLLEEATSYDRDGTCAALADASMGLHAGNTILQGRGQGTLAQPDLAATLEDFFRKLVEFRENPGSLYAAEAKMAIDKTEGRQDGILIASSYGCSNPHVISFYENVSRFARGEEPAHQSDLVKNKKSRAFQACDRAIRFNLNGPATEGDLEQVCTCVDRAFVRSRATVPEKFRDNFLWQRPEGEVLNPTAIGYVSDGDLVPPRVQSAADILNWEVRTCLGRLPLRGQLTGVFARDWSDEPNPRWDYLGPIVPPRAGPAGPIDDTLGGLLFLKLQYVRHMVWDAFLRDGLDVEARNNALRFLDEFHSDASDLVILDCSYRTQAENGYNRWMSTQSYFYWYQPEWNPLTEELLKAAPADHPVHEIGPPREACPLRVPEF